MQPRLAPTFEAAATSKLVAGVAAIALDVSGKVLFKGAYGVTNIDDPSAAPMTESTPTMLWSCTKLVTCVAALQLLEQGKLRLDDPVEKHVPAFRKLQVIEEMKDGKAVLRAPKTTATVLNLMTHTSGLGYDMFDQTIHDWRASEGPATVGTMEAFMTPMLFDPGDKFAYGTSIDWLGFVIEAIAGVPLDAYIEQHILQPLGMKNTGGHVATGTPWLHAHHRRADGGLTANPAMSWPAAPEKFPGGHYLYSTLDDYSSFLLTVLNNGTHPTSGVQVLQADTVKTYLFADQIHSTCAAENIGVIRTADTNLTLEGVFLPGLKKSWSCGLMLNPEGSLKGRSPGSGSWAGLGNLYYWLDPKAGKLGLLMTNILPFMDREALHLFDELERAVYGHDHEEDIGEVGRNWSEYEGSIHK